MSIFSDLPPVRFGGPDSTDEFQFRAYDAKRVVMGRTMADWLRCAVCYWHSFNWPGSDIFGAGTLPRPVAAFSAEAATLTTQRKGSKSG